MKRKKITILLIFILMFFICKTTIYAANEITLTVKPNTTNLKQGEELSLTFSVENVGLDEEILDVAANLEFDSTVFEIVKLSPEQLNSEQKEILNEYEEIFGVLDILNIQDKWLIGGFGEGEDYLITVVYLEETGGINKGNTKNVGEIKLKVLDSANNGMQDIKLTEIEANGEYSIADVNVSDINIQGTQISSGDEDKEDEEYEEIESEQSSNEAKQDLAYTGTEDVIPFIAIILIVAIITYIKCREYREI